MTMAFSGGLAPSPVGAIYNYNNMGANTVGALGQAGAAATNRIGGNLANIKEGYDQGGLAGAYQGFRHPDTLPSHQPDVVGQQNPPATGPDAVDGKGSAPTDGQAPDARNPGDEAYQRDGTGTQADSPDAAAPAGTGKDARVAGKAPEDKADCNTCKKKKKDKKQAAADGTTSKSDALNPDKGPSPAAATQQQLAQAKKTDGLAVSGVINTSTGENRTELAGFDGGKLEMDDGTTANVLPRNGTHATIFNDLTGSSPQLGAGGDTIGYTVTDQGISFKSTSLNQQLFGGEVAPTDLQSKAIPQLNEKFGTDVTKGW